MKGNKEMTDLELKIYELLRRTDCGDLTAIDIFQEFRTEFRNNIENCFKLLRNMENSDYIRRDCQHIKPCYLIKEKYNG